MTALLLSLLLRIMLWTKPSAASHIANLRLLRDHLRNVNIEPGGNVESRSLAQHCDIRSAASISGGGAIPQLLLPQFPALQLPLQRREEGSKLLRSFGDNLATLNATLPYFLDLLPENSIVFILPIWEVTDGIKAYQQDGVWRQMALNSSKYRNFFDEWRKFDANESIKYTLDSPYRFFAHPSCTAEYFVVFFNLTAIEKLLVVYVPVAGVGPEPCGSGNKCLNRNKTRCEPIEGALRFDPDGYRCCCGEEGMCVNASEVDANGSNLCGGVWFESDMALRKVFISINAVCCSFCFVLIFVVLAQRKVQFQEYNVRGWALVEIFLFGAGLLYCVLILEFFPAVNWTCCLIVWFRAIGFVTFYGSIILKIYRNLVEYRVRKAHHVYVKEKDLLKVLGLGVVTTGTGLAAWTVGVAQREREGDAPLVMILNAQTPAYSICRLEWWYILWHLYEAVFLLYGLRLSYKARNTTWVERHQFSIVVLLEFVFTLSSNLARYLLWYRSNPDTVLIISFIQVHLTVTVAMLLILIPKIYLQFYYVTEQGRVPTTAGAGSNKAHPSLAKLRDNLVNGTIDFAEIPITEMNPEDIRAELKRVYTQLRMYKLKNVYTENPHISKNQKKNKKNEKNQSSRRRVSVNTPSQSTRMKRVEEEGISFIRSNAEEETMMLHEVPPSPPNDFTVQSSPHNVYLSQGSTSIPTSKRYQLEADLSVRV